MPRYAQMHWEQIDRGHLPRPDYETCGGKHYSTNIADAWEVVEKIGRSITPNRYSVNFIIEWDRLAAEWRAGWAYYSDDGPEYDFVGEADTAPLAICLAALKAVGK